MTLLKRTCRQCCAGFASVRFVGLVLFLLHGIDEVEADVSELDILASDDKLDGSCFINPSDLC